MLQHLETTTLILVAAVLWSLLLMPCVYLLTAHGWQRLLVGVAAPAVIAAPVVIVLAYRVANIRLLFPVHLLTHPGRLMMHALVPGLLLLFASGWWLSATTTMAQEWRHWSQARFVTFARALALRHALFRLVFWRTFVQAWRRSLPWLFAELTIVEAVFNAPGLAWSLWEAARQRQLDVAAGHALWLMWLYLLSALGTALLAQRLGRRLTGYC